MKNKVLVLMAHADDAEIWAGGTLLNHHKQGDDILFVYLFCDDEIRKQEAINAAKRFNATADFWSWPISLQESANLIAEFKPTVIITHWEEDTHHEHVKVYESVLSMIPILVVYHHLMFSVYCCDCHNSISRNPNICFVPTDYIDITSVWDEKQKLISIYESQPAKYWLEMIGKQNRMHGSRTGVEYAEGFIHIPVLGIIKKSRNLLEGG